MKLRSRWLLPAMLLSLVPGLFARGTKRVDFTVSGYEGAEVLENFPVLVRLSERIEGFRYADCAGDGADLTFWSGKTELPREIERWDPAGESLVWVRLPAMEKGTVFQAVYADRDARIQPACQSDGSVWKPAGYVGVWHMAESEGVVRDATANGLDATPMGRGDSASHPEGVVGMARSNAVETEGRWEDPIHTHLSIPSYDRFALGASFTFSGWYDATKYKWFPRLVSRKASNADPDGWEVEVGKADGIFSRGADRIPGVTATIPDLVTGGWIHLGRAFDEALLTIYVNGARGASGEVHPVLDNDRPLSIGGNANGADPCSRYNGYLDEFRLRRGASSADWMAAEEASARDPAFLTASRSTLVDSSLLVSCNVPCGTAQGFDPPVGTLVKGLASGATMPAVAPGGIIDAGKGIRGVCTGWKLYGIDHATGEYVFDESRPDATGTGHFFTYTHPTPPLDSRLEWQVAVSNHLSVVVNDAAFGSVDVAVRWLAAGDTVTITASAAEGCSFRAWSGDLQENDPTASTITLRADRPLSVTATFLPAGNDLWYVEANGNDANSGRSRAEAFGTVAKALSVAKKAGDAILVGPGSFPADATLFITNAVTVCGTGADRTVLTTPQAPTGAYGYRTVYMNHKDAVLRDVTVTGGLGASEDPVAFYGLGILIDQAGGTVDRCRVTGNRSRIYMSFGAVAMLSADARLLSSVIDHNVSWYEGESYLEGGGIYMRQGIVENCLIHANESQHGGGIYFQGEGLIRNCTIAANRASYQGGGIYWMSAASLGRAGLENCVVAGNMAPEDPGRGRPDWYAGQYEVKLDERTANCLFGAPAVGTNSLQGDPRFADPASGDFSLLAGSPAIDGGRALELVGTGDLAGAPRVQGQAIDLGCLETDPARVSLGLAIAPSALFEGEEIAFRASLAGDDLPASPTYRWTLTDRRGERVDFSGATGTKALPKAGRYDVTVTASDPASGFTWSLTRPVAVHVAARTNYFAAVGSSTPVYPWKTPETAGNDLAEIASELIDGSVVILPEGEFPLSSTVVVSSSAKLLGQGMDKTVFVRSGEEMLGRFFDLNAPGALLQGVTIRGAIHGAPLDEPWLLEEFGNGIRIGGCGGTLRGSRVTGCSSFRTGWNSHGAVAIVGPAGRVSGCVIDYNTNTYGKVWGGGLALKNGIAENCLIRRNTILPGDNCGGAGVYLKGDGLLRNCTIVENDCQANQAGGGGVAFDVLYWNDLNRMENCILAGNKDTAAGKGFGWPEWKSFRSRDWYRQVIVHCLFGASEAFGIGGLSGDPLFKDAAAGDFTLRADSPAHDAGLYGDWMEGAVDLAGHPRVDHRQRVDIGCYERPYAPANTLLLLR